MTIQLKNISKAYKQAQVLENINLMVNRGDIFSLIGKNGVGKTTLLEILVGLTNADEGEILFNEKLIGGNDNDWKMRIGVALSNDHLVDSLTIEEYLILLGNIYGLEKSLAASRSKSLIAFFFEEGENVNKPIKFYSSGMKKKALLCAAFIHNPEIILLDEPFTFLDPAACSNLCAFLIGQKDNGKIIILSSHDLLYIDKVSTRIGVLDDKRLVLDDSYENFKEENDFFKENKMLKKVLNYDNKNLASLELSLK